MYRNLAAFSYDIVNYFLQKNMIVDVNKIT